MKWLKSSGKKCRDLNEKLIHHLIIPTSNQNVDGECLWGNVSIQNWFSIHGKMVWIDVGRENGNLLQQSSNSSWNGSVQLETPVKGEN